MPRQVTRITADDLRRRAERLREHVPDEQEAQLRERGAALLEEAAVSHNADEALTLVLNAGKLLGRARKRWQELNQPIAPKPRRKRGKLSGKELTRRQDEIIAESGGILNRKSAEARIQEDEKMSPRTQRRRRADTGEYLRPSQLKRKRK